MRPSGDTPRWSHGVRPRRRTVLAHRVNEIAKPTMPVGCSGATSTLRTWDDRGPWWHQAIICSTAGAGPSNTASTDPSPRLRTVPATPSRPASRRHDSRKPTPCTRPAIRTRRRIDSSGPVTPSVYRGHRRPGRGGPVGPGAGPGRARSRCCVTQFHQIMCPTVRTWVRQRAVRCRSSAPGCSERAPRSTPRPGVPSVGSGGCGKWRSRSDRE